MQDTMISARIPAEKMRVGNAILKRDGLTTTQAIGLLYDRLIHDGSAEFLQQRELSLREWQLAAQFVDAISAPQSVSTQFDDMSSKEIRRERLKTRGLV